MGIKVLFIRHATAPTPEGCRWCGVPFRGHASRHVPSKKWHIYATPTEAQVRARIHAKYRLPHVCTDVCVLHTKEEK